MNHKLSLFILLFSTELSQASFLNVEVLKEYESLSLALFILVTIAIIVLTYLTIRYKKLLNQQHKILFKKEMDIKQLKQTSNNQEISWLGKEHTLDKKIFELEQSIRDLERVKKEGLKSQVVTKIEEYQSRREKVLDRSNISR